MDKKLKDAFERLFHLGQLRSSITPRNAVPRMDQVPASTGNNRKGRSSIYLGCLSAVTGSLRGQRFRCFWEGIFDDLGVTGKTKALDNQGLS